MVSNFINPEIYEQKSLSGTFNDLITPSQEITLEKIINFVLKYLYAYRHPDSVNSVVSLPDIESIMNYGADFFSKVKFIPELGASVAIGIDKQNSNFPFFASSTYAIAMLGDIAATTVIFKEIIQCVLYHKKTEEELSIMDLGTGSGILTIAGIIGAYRMKYKQASFACLDRKRDSNLQLIKVFEGLLDSSDCFINKSVVFTKDTTNKDTIQEAKKFLGESPLGLVINENISTTGVAMGVGPDPFHQNNLALLNGVGENGLERTTFFPNSILMGLGPKKLLRTKNELFGSLELFEFEQKIRDTIGNKIPDDWSIFKEVFPLGIEIEGSIVPMHTVGNICYDLGLTKRNPGWRHRWKEPRNIANA